jgi:hypothetical protein
LFRNPCCEFKTTPNALAAKLHRTLYDKDPGLAPYVVVGCAIGFFVVACWGYDPQRGFGGLTERAGGSA